MMQSTDLMLEHRLEKILNPVQPDPGFIDRLYQRLTHPPEIHMEKRPTGKLIFLVGLGLFVGACVWFVLRLIYRFARRL